MTSGTPSKRKSSGKSASSSTRVSPQSTKTQRTLDAFLSSSRLATPSASQQNKTPSVKKEFKMDAMEEDLVNSPAMLSVQSSLPPTGEPKTDAMDLDQQGNILILFVHFISIDI